MKIWQVVIFLAFQHTYVNSNVVGLELPDPDTGRGDYAEGWDSGA